jgi:hypothetical protein
MMKAAVEEFVDAQTPSDDGSRPVERRIVVFIDDLDRCLPLNALSVLESMKLFFDLDGFIFVAGLDQRVIAQAIELHYAARQDRPDAVANVSDVTDNTDESQPSGIGGMNYIKKIFQVQFALPPLRVEQLDELVPALAGAGLLAAQSPDLGDRMVAHLKVYSEMGGINARDVKRLINAYVLQAKLLRRLLRDSGEVDLDAVLALQVIGARPDWERVWRRLEYDPEDFVYRLGDALGKGEDTVWIDGEALPPLLVDYLSKGPGKTLLKDSNLKAYIRSIRASQTTEPQILQAQEVVDDLLRYTVDVDANSDRGRLAAALESRLAAWPASSTAPWAPNLEGHISQLRGEVRILGDEKQKDLPIDEWKKSFRARLDRLEMDLRVQRDDYSLVSRSST